jgi:shikimate kinase
MTFPMTLTERLQGTNLYLIGMMGAGKSSTGTALAQVLGYQFFDTDAVLEAAAGRTIPEIFAEEGEAAFRQQETEVLAQLSAYRRLVIATQGIGSMSGSPARTRSRRPLSFSEAWLRE